MGYFQKKEEKLVCKPKKFHNFLKEEDGMGTVEIILIIVDIFTN